MDVRATEVPIVLKKRRRLSLSVRALMALVMVVGGGLGWITYRARVQREAVAVIGRAGGSVWLNRPWTDKPRLGTVKHPGLAWMRRLLGWEYFAKVTTVQLFEHRRGKGDQVLRAACKLSDLDDLMLLDTETTDDVAEGIGNLTNL